MIQNRAGACSTFTNSTSAKQYNQSLSRNSASIKLSLQEHEQRMSIQQIAE